jgi:tetratricopeptide (TPR) repeat protein
MPTDANEAVARFQEEVKAQPSSAEAHFNLGQALLRVGRYDEAAAQCCEAARLKPDNSTIHLVLGDVWRSAGRFPEAHAAYAEALRLQPSLAQAHANLGLLLRQQGKLYEAIAPLRRAVEIDPQNAPFWRYLAEVHEDWESYAEAAECWRQVLALAPHHGAHLGLATALHEQGRFDEAESHIRIALQMAPRSASVYFGLADLQEQRGNLAEAEAAFREALALDPTFTTAQVRLVLLLRGRVSDADIAAIHGRLADPQLTDEWRANLQFALASIFDARGDYPHAAQWARQANALCVEQARRRHVPYDPAEHRRFIDEVLKVFDPAFFRRTAGGGLTTQRPVFIVGLPRSGTTLVEQILASHPAVHGAGELRLGWQSFMDIPAALDREGPALACVPALDAVAIRRLAEKHDACLKTLDGGRTKRIIDKMPDNYQYLGLLAAMFPRATFIHCRRELRDVALSCWMTNFRWTEWTSDIDHIAMRFQEYARLTDHWRSVLPVPLVEVDYEEIVANLEGSARRLVAACGLPWDSACLEFHRTRRPVRTASAVQVRTPLYKHAVGRWQNYKDVLADLFAVT